MENILLIGISVDEFRDLISNCVEESIKRHMPIEQPHEETLLNVEQMAQYLGVSKATVHTWKKEGRIPFHRLGRRVYFKKSEILKGY